MKVRGAEGSSWNSSPGGMSRGFAATGVVAASCWRSVPRAATKIIVTKGDKGGATFQAADNEGQQGANSPQDESAVADLRHGRKGLFTAEIEPALLAKDVEVAVHSAKDLPSEIGPGAEIAAVLPRAPTDDVLVSRYRGGLAALQEGAT